VLTVMGVILSIEYLSERLTPHPLPTKDGGVLCTVGDARASSWTGALAFITDPWGTYVELNERPNSIYLP
jgi:hypothetical protein